MPVFRGERSKSNDGGLNFLRHQHSGILRIIPCPCFMVGINISMYGDGFGHGLVHEDVHEDGHGNEQKVELIWGIPDLPSFGQSGTEEKTNDAGTGPIPEYGKVQSDT